VRNFPVHPRLVELGFLDYVKACATDRLFPALRPDKYGVASSSFSTWWGKYLDELGITDSTRVFHSFRHAFVERAKVRARLVPSEVREAIVGHLSAKQIEMTYGNQLYPLEPQVDAIRHIDWPDLDLHVTPICSPH
jgi:integrase